MLGGPVTGGDFFDRKRLLIELRKDIPHAHHVLIGPRGCGKSSILKQLEMGGKVNGLIPVYIDVGRVVPRTHRNVIKKLGREVLYATARKRGLLRSMPALVADKVVKLVDFARENLRVKISDWITLYFDPNPDLTELMEQTFSTIESYGVELLVMIDEFTSLVKLSGPHPNDEDMNFVEAVRGHISEAEKAHYLLSGSQVGLMNLIVKAKFGRLLVPKKVEEIEERGADELIRAKIKRRIPEEFVEEVKIKTRLWPLYLQAYCIAANLHGRKVSSLTDVEEKVFNLLRGHFLYLESLLAELELMALLKLDDGKVSDLASKLGVSYSTTQTALRCLELKGFVRKVSRGTYESVDSMFSAWLKKEYETPC